MGLSFHCPQCSQAVPALPTQMGQQITCAACGAQFRLSPMLLGGNGQAAAAKAPPGATAAFAKPTAPPLAAPVSPAPTAAPAPPVATVVKMPPPRPIPAASPALAPPVAAPAPPPRSPLTTHPLPPPNVARFIAAASQDSTVQLTADGKLPELSLAEATAKKQKTSDSNASPLVLGLALVASTVVSILLMVADFDGGGPSTATADQARAKIQEYFIQEGPLLPYQQLLKDASLAHSLGRFDEEQRCYQRVRDMLRSESKNQYSGVTGTKSSDRELLNLLGILLNEKSR
jgi:hypothetical protein